MKHISKRLLSMLLVLTMVFGMFAMTAAAQTVAADSYDWQGQWIWTNDAASEGQWINLRKTFTLNEVPETVEARVSVDTKYWMWVNGELAVFEGQLKTGPSKTSWYYDCEDIAEYLVKGENTIAVLAYYVGRDSFSTTKTGNPAFLFDAAFPAGALADGGTRVVSDTSWKVMRDPAYQTPPSQPNYRVGATNIKYNAGKELTGWQNPGFDDSAWANATVKTMSASDPRNTLAERSIPQWKVEDIVTYTADGENAYTVKKGSQQTELKALSLPESYVVTGEFYVETPETTGSAAYGLSVCMTDENHFYMPQVSLYEYSSKVDYIRFKPHIWNGSVKAYDELIANRSDVVANEDRYNTKHTVRIEVDAETMTVYVDGKEFGTLADSTLARAGGSIGMRQSWSEKTRVYSMKVEDDKGNLIWEDNISESQAGSAVTCFKKLSGNAPVLKKDEQGETYLYVNNCIITAAEPEGGKWTQLSLPEEYTVSGTFQVLMPNGATSASVGLGVCMSDAQNFYMPQISMKETTAYDGLRFKPHKMQNGAWTVYDIVDHTGLIAMEDRYTTKFKVEMKVDAEKITVYVNGTEFGVMNNTDLARVGSSIGIRQSGGEHTAIYDLQITDQNGKLLWKDDISKTAVGATPTLFKTLTGGTCTVKTDDAGVKYLYLNNTICTVGELQYYSVDTYSFRNSTNMQGTPYLKVRSEKGGEVIDITSDSTAHNGGESVRHWYVTRAGEQEWEGFGWMNGWVIDFEIPSTVEVLELGWRKSGYDSEVGGTASTSNANLNQLYQEAYDTLDITMRDTYMDCPDRERCQWWGDAVNEMQQAAYAMNDTAKLLYKKTLTQAVGWSAHMDGPLTTVVATPTFSELPVQSLAGTHSLWQYYLYYGETDILEYCYDAFMKYLKLWTVSDSGEISHRAGDWDWMDWGDHADTAVMETSWYYVAMNNMKNVAQLLGKSEADVAFLENRMELIHNGFETLYWNPVRGAYYGNTDNGKADDRGNALAVYAGLADPQHYPDLLKVFQTIENSSPYMEKYVLEAMYMMGYAEEALTRTLKRYDSMVKDGYPTLYEYWAANKLSGNGGTGTRNHAWTGAPLSMMYMFNAGIIPTDGGFRTFRVRPMLGNLESAQASTDTVSGTISVEAAQTGAQITLSVTVPSGSEQAQICVPRLEGKPTMISLDGTVVYDGGKAVNLPAGVTYAGEDADYVNFTVAPGTYSFLAVEDAADSEATHTITVNAVGSGTLQVNGQRVETPYTYTGSGEVTIVATPDAGSRTMEITGSYAETVISTAAVTRTYTLDRDLTCTVIFDEMISTKMMVDVDFAEGNRYPAEVALSVNGTLTATQLPAKLVVNEGDTITGTITLLNNVDFTVDSWKVNGAAVAEGDTLEYTVSDSTTISVHVADAGYVNLAEGKQVTASQVNADWAASNLTDGILSYLGGTNGWSSKGLGTSTTFQAETAVIDLGEATTFNRFHLYPRNLPSKKADVGVMNCPTAYTFYVSDDNNTWTPVYTTADGEVTNGYAPVVIALEEEVSGRYVKFECTAVNHGDENGNVYVQLSELGVYLTEKETPSDVVLTISGEEEADATGEAVSFTVSAQNMDHLGNVILSFAISEETLTQPVVTAADGWMFLKQTYKNGVLKVALGSINGVSGDGEIMTLTCKPTGKTGAATVKIIEAEASAFVGDLDEVYVNVDLTAAEASTEMTFNCYDVNRDGVVNILDITRAQRYYGTANVRCDVNEDGEVNINDLILILNHFTQAI